MADKENDEMLEMIQQGLNDDDASGSVQDKIGDGGHQEDVDNQEEEDLSGNDAEDNQEAAQEDDTAKSEADKLDVSKYFNGFESLEEVNAAIQRGQKFTPEAEEELETLRQSKKTVDTLQEQIKSLKERQPFNKKELYQIDKLSVEDPEKAAILSAYKFGDQSAETALKLQMQLKDPKLAEDNPGYFDRALRKRYPDFYDEGYGPEDLEYQDAKTEMIADANKAREYLDSELGKVEIPATKSDEDIKAEQEQFIKSWQPSFEKVKSDLTKIDIPVFDENTENELKTAMVFEIPKEDNKLIQEAAANIIGTSGFEPTPENVKKVGDAAKAIYFWDHKAEIFTKFANTLLSEGSDAALKKFNNPAKSGSDVSKASKGQKPQDGADVLYKDMMAGFGV